METKLTLLLLASLLGLVYCIAAGAAYAIAFPAAGLGFVLGATMVWKPMCGGQNG